MSDFIVSVISFLVVLGPLVLIHELGHFLAARSVGVTVLEFGLGFPPRALKLFSQQGTLFSLNWLPIGGFVRPLGEDFVRPLGEGEIDPDRLAFEKMNDQREARGLPRLRAKSLMEVGPWQRIVFMSAGAAMNIIGAFLILIVSAMIGQPAPAVLVFGTAPGSVAEAAGLQPGDEVIALNGTTINPNDQEASTKIRDTLLNSLTKTVSFTVLREGQSQILTIDPPKSSTQNSRGVFVDGATEGFPADGVLQRGDIILNIDGKAMNSVPVLQEYVKSNAGKELTVAYLREGVENTAKLTPRQEGDTALIGISIIPFDAFFGVAVENTTNGGLVKYNPGEAVTLAGSRLGFLIENTATAPIKLISGQLSGEEGRVVSPVGIAQISSEILTTSVANNSPYLLLNFIATISVALAITNLLPIPGLDGGRILFVIIELIRGKPMSPEREGLVHLAGLALLMGLVLLLVINDIVDPIGSILR